MELLQRMAHLNMSLPAADRLLPIDLDKAQMDGGGGGGGNGGVGDAVTTRAVGGGGGAAVAAAPSSSSSSSAAAAAAAAARTTSSLPQHRETEQKGRATTRFCYAITIELLERPKELGASHDDEQVCVCVHARAVRARVCLLCAVKQKLACMRAPPYSLFACMYLC